MKTSKDRDRATSVIVNSKVRNGAVFVLVCMGVVAIIALLIALIVGSTSVEPDRDVGPAGTNRMFKARQVSARRPVKVREPAIEDSKKTAKLEKTEPQKVGEVRDGKLLMPDGSFHVVKGEVTNDYSRLKSPTSIFKHPAENIIANILSVSPGGMLIGTPQYNGRFVKSFLKSLNSPIVDEQDDSDDVKQLKHFVNEAKKELKAAYDRGEDIEQIIMESREELQRFYRFRKEINSEVLKYSRDSAESELDVDDCLKAANKVLEEKGIAPLDGGPLVRLKMKMNGMSQFQ